MRKFIAEQYTQAGLKLHPGVTPARVRPQARRSGSPWRHRGTMPCADPGFTQGQLGGAQRGGPRGGPLRPGPGLCSFSTGVGVGAWTLGGDPTRPSAWAGSNGGMPGSLPWFKQGWHCSLPWLAVRMVQVVKQADGRLTVVLTGKDGSSMELKDNDQVLMATGESALHGRGCRERLRG